MTAPRGGRSVRHMATGTQDVESALIESVCERVRERVPQEEVAEAEAFVRSYYRRAPAADLAGRELVDLYGAALAHWSFGRDRPAGEPAGARLQPDVRAARLAVAAHRDRDRQRRHAVPRGLGEHGAQPARARHPRARPSGDRRRVLHAPRGRPPGRGLRGARRGAARRARRRARRGRRLAADAGAHGGARGPARELASGPRRSRRGRGGPGVAGVAARPPLHVPRLPRVHAGRRHPARRRGHRASACCAARPAATSRRPTRSCRPPRGRSRASRTCWS